MLFCDQIARTEEEAVQAAARFLRVNQSDLVVKSVIEVPEGVKVRVEAKRSRGQDALEILKAILDNMKISAELFFIESPERITINVNGLNLGLIIGKNGRVLDSLEIIVSAIHNKKFEIFKPVVINPGGYRDNKRKALMAILRKAVEVAESTEKVGLPSMTQQDRKLVHQLLKEFPGFRSRSIGEGKDRRVYIYKETAQDKLIEEARDDVGIPPEEVSDKE